MYVRLALVVGITLLYLGMLPPLLADGETVDITAYDMELELNPGSGTMDASVVLDLTALVDGLQTVTFSLNDDMTLKGVFGESGKPLEFGQGDEAVTVTLKTPLMSGEQTRLRFDYSFTSPAAEKDKLIWGYVGPEVSFLIYEYLWYPMIWGDRATATVSITVPEGLRAISIGELKEKRTAGGATRYTWESQSPSRGVSIVAAEYMEKTILVYPLDETAGHDSLYEAGRVIKWGGSGDGDLPMAGTGHDKLIPVTCYLFPEDYHKADNLLESTSEVLEVLAQKFHGYPYDEFRVVEMPDFFFGGHGDQGFIMLHSMAIKLDSEEFLAHEVSHNWWGSLVFAEGQPSLKSIGGYRMFTPRDSNLDYLPKVESHNLWLHEGLATYSGVLYVEEQHGKKAMLESLSDKKEEYLVMRAKYGDAPISNIQEEYSKGLYHAIVYSKGAYVLHMLRYVVGDETFFEIMNTYQERYKEKSATVSDFQRVSEEVYGMDLDWFFDEWIYEVSLPDFSIKDVEVSDTPDGYSVDVTIHQEGDMVTMPVEVTLHTRSGEVTKRVWVMGETKTVNFLTASKPQYVGLDENGWLLESKVTNNIYETGYGPGMWDKTVGSTEKTALLALGAVLISFLFLAGKSLKPAARENFI
jgi:aminopeptidase N